VIVELVELGALLDVPHPDRLMDVFGWVGRIVLLRIGCRDQGLGIEKLSQLDQSFDGNSIVDEPGVGA